MRRTGSALSVLMAAACLASAADTRKVTVTITVPDTGWAVEIDEVHQVDQGLWVISQLTRSAGMAAQMISTVSDSVTVEAGAQPLKHFAIGKTWNWQNTEAVEFLADRKSLDKKLQTGKCLFKRAGKAVAEASASRYMVAYRKDVFTDGKTADGETLEQLAARHVAENNGKGLRMLRIINGFIAEFTPADAQRLKELAEVKYVEKDR